MNMDDINERVNILLAARTRRLIHWGGLRGKIDGTNPILAQIINKGIWHYWGYDRLRDCFVQELGLGLKDAMSWTKAAIEKGHEDGSKYSDGNKYDDGTGQKQQPGPAKAGPPGGGGTGAGPQRAGDPGLPRGGGGPQPGGGSNPGGVAR